MSNFQLGKDVQEILTRLSRIEGALAGHQDRGKRKPCGCSKSNQPLRVGAGTEYAVGDNESLLNYKSGHWDRWDAGDCEVTFVDFFVYSNGDWRVNFRAHDNGIVFGDRFTLKISIRNGTGQEVEKFVIMNSEYIAEGGNDDSPRSGNSEQIQRQYQDIEITKCAACIGCNDDCQP